MDDLNSALEGYATTKQLTEGLSGKAAKSHTHTSADVTGLAAVATSGKYSDLSGKPTSLPANGGNADTVDGKHAADFAAASHTHDSRYYTETETNTLLNAKANKADIPTTLPANGGRSDTTNHQINHYLGQGIDVLTYATSDNCPYNVNTKVRIMNSPTCPTNYGYNAADNDFWYDIYKLDGKSWVTIKAYDVRGNVEFINSWCNGTWSGWVRCNDGGNAQSLNGFMVSNGLDLVGNPTASGGKPVLGVFDDASGSHSFFDLRDGSRNVLRIQLSTNEAYHRPRAYRYNAASDTWTEVAYHMAAYASTAEPLTASNICLRNLSSGTAAATTDNCPVGAWYGKHS